MKRKIKTLSLALLLSGALACAQGLHFNRALAAPEAPLAKMHVRLVITGEGQSSGSAPTYCTIASPCVEVTWANVDVASTVITNSSGVETSGPATATVWQCLVTSTQNCALPASNPPLTGSPWSASAVTNGQNLAQTSAMGGPFYIANAVYGATYALTVTNNWTGSQGGSASAYAATFQFSMPAVPAAAPGAVTGIGAQLAD